jgi:hypothetical protein
LSFAAFFCHQPAAARFLRCYKLDHVTSCFRREFAMSTAGYRAPTLFESSFDNIEQQRLRDEDNSAFAGVSGILLMIVSAGLLLGIASLIVILTGG